MSSQVEMLVDKLANATENNKIRWTLLKSDNFKSNREIDKYFNLHNDEEVDGPNVPSINLIKSFYTNYNGGTIFLFNKFYHYDFEKEYFVLAIQSNQENKVIDMNSMKEYQSDIFRLFNLIERQFHNVTDFVENILKDL